MVVKELKSVSHFGNKRLKLPRCQGREAKPAGWCQWPSLASQVSEARQKHLSLGTGAGGLASAQNISW